MKVVVDEDRCRGHGVCCSTCPEVFGLTDEGYSEVLVAEVPDDLAESANEAVLNCPERAISASA